MLAPAPLRPGARVAVIAPSSPFSPVLGWRGLAALRKRYRLRFDRALFSRRGYLAGSDERRRDELLAALRDPEVEAIVAMRGGYGANRIGHDLPWERLREHPRWIVGFSDITALHLEAQRVGVMSLHASHVTALGGPDLDGSLARWFDALETPMAQRAHRGLRTLVAGEARGPLVGGNLALIHAVAAAGRLQLPAGAVLFIEDVGERPYRVDRMLSTLRLGGHLAQVSGVVLGEFADCAAGPDGIDVEQVVREAFAPFHIPVAAGLVAGHGARNHPLLLGAPASLEANQRSAQLLLGDSRHGTLPG